MGDTTRSVDPRTGKVIWARTLRNSKTPAAGDDVLTPPAIANGKVFVGTAAGELYAFSERTGEVLWRLELGEPIRFSLQLLRAASSSARIGVA